MREIKFRIFNQGTKKMKVFTLRDAICNIFDLSFRGYDKAFIMQFTSLLDKSGKEICEGDIVKIDMQDGKIFEVKYEKFTSEEFEGIGFVFPEIHNLKVIGNIYENKELLK